MQPRTTLIYSFPEKSQSPDSSGNVDFGSRPPSAAEREAARRRPGASPGREACDTVEAWRDACRAANDGDRDDFVAKVLKTSNPAPLNPFVKAALQIFLEQDCHDETTLSVAMMGAGGRTARVRKSYRLVAKEMLSQLRNGGYLYRDDRYLLRPTLRGSEGLSTRRRAEVFLDHLASQGVHAFLVDDGVKLDFKKAKPTVSIPDTTGAAMYLQADILKILDERARKPPPTKGTGREGPEESDESIYNALTNPLVKAVTPTFEERNCHDGATLGVYVSGATSLLPRRDEPGLWKKAATFSEAYHDVAEDIIDQMYCAGILYKDKWGWMYPTFRGTKGLPNRRRAELFLMQLEVTGVDIFLKWDGRPYLNFGAATSLSLSSRIPRLAAKDLKDYIRDTTAAAKELRAEILDILEKSRGAQTTSLPDVPCATGGAR